MDINLHHGRLNYLVGEERSLGDLLTEAEVMPILEGAVRAGAGQVSVCSDDGTLLWQCGSADGAGHLSVKASGTIRVEGEPVASVTVTGDGGRGDLLQGMALLLAANLTTLAQSSLKRMLTTEMHTTVVNQTWEELMDTNQRLVQSEARYRELSERLEIKVEERTAELQRASLKMIEQEKMASIGQLAAGVAHEINNPMGFITSNLGTLQKYVGRFTEMLAFSRSIFESAGSSEAKHECFTRKWRELKLDFISADVEELLRQSLEGAERVKRIVADLKGFSHIDDVAEVRVDVNSEIDRTFGVLAHELPPDAIIIKDYAELPGFVCSAALLCQVFLNIILNAVQAKPQGLRLTVSTSHDGDWITIVLADNGPGIPDEVRRRIFEPFFTTKDVGKGTGMGLAVVYDVVTRYQGSVDVDSTPGSGTVFTVKLPLVEAEDV